MHRVAILAYDQMPAFELGCATELFALARPEYPDWYRAEVITFDEGSLAATGNLRLIAKPVNSLQDYDTLVVPGWNTQSKKIRLNMAEQIVEFAGAGKRIISFCSGSFLLAQLGLLNGMQATTHWRYAETFAERFPKVDYVDNVLYTRQNNIACSAGSASALDLGLDIIREDFGPQVANQVARRLVISPHRQGGQAQYVETPLPATDNAFSETLDWALEHLDQTLVVDDLAKQAKMSRRSFDRHFRASIGMSPKAWLNQQRVHHARKILEKESINMDVLAQKVGFDNAITLRFNFNKYLGVSPSQYQAQFSLLS